MKEGTNSELNLNYRSSELWQVLDILWRKAYLEFHILSSTRAYLSILSSKSPNQMHPMKIQKCIQAASLMVLILLMSSCGQPPKEELNEELNIEPGFRRVLVSNQIQSEAPLQRDESDYYPFIREAYGIMDPSKLVFVDGSLRVETSDLNVLEEWKFYLAGLVENSQFGHLQYFKLELEEVNGKLYIADRPNNLLQMKYCWNKNTGKDCGYSNLIKDGPEGRPMIKYQCNCSQEEVFSGTDTRGMRLEEPAAH